MIVLDYKFLVGRTVLNKSSCRFGDQIRFFLNFQTGLVSALELIRTKRSIHTSIMYIPGYLHLPR